MKCMVCPMCKRRTIARPTCKRRSWLARPMCKRRSLPARSRCKRRSSLLRSMCKRRPIAGVPAASIEDFVKGRIHNLLLNNLPFLLPQIEDFDRRFDDYRWSEVLSPLLIACLRSHSDTPQGWSLMIMPQTFVRYWSHMEIPQTLGNRSSILK